MCPSRAVASFVPFYITGRCVFLPHVPSSHALPHVPSCPECHTWLLYAICFTCPRTLLAFRVLRALSAVSALCVLLALLVLRPLSPFCTYVPCVTLCFTIPVYLTCSSRLTCVTFSMCFTCLCSLAHSE